MTGYINRKEELRRYFPYPAYILKDGQGLALILEIFGEHLNTLDADISAARDQFLLATAEGYYLREIGKDLDVFKPKGFRMRDQIYRQLIEIITNSSKNIEYIFERILKLFFGYNVFTSGLAFAYSYQKNMINIDIKENALIVASSRDLYGTTYLHRVETGHFDGWGSPAWTSSLPSLLPSGSMSITLASLPTGIPSEGFVEIGTYGASDYETKQYTLSGNTLTFIGPTYYKHNAGSALRGPKTPDDYPSGYLFNTLISAALTGSYAIGEGSIVIGPGYEDFPTVGTCYLGNPSDTNFESIGFTRVGDTLTFYGVTVNAHTSGEPVVIPCFYRKYRAVSETAITQGTGMSAITVDSCADFPGEPFQGAVILNKSFANEEIVPFRGRSLGDNTQALISSDYRFIYDHEIGETMHLMALKSAPDVTGIDFAFYLNDTESLKQQLFALLARIKVVGCKLVITVY